MAGAGEDPVAPFVASISTPKRGFPTPTTSPGLAKSLVMIPAAGLLISTVTLSVSILATGSSISTQSPSFLTNSATVPSVMDSATWGKGKTFSKCGRGYLRTDSRCGGGGMRAWMKGEGRRLVW